MTFGDKRARARWWWVAAVAAGGAVLGMVPAMAAGARHRAVGLRDEPSAPSGNEVITLFSGKAEELSANWVRRGSEQPAAWRIVDGAMVARGGDIATKQEFGDFQLHVEFKEPSMPNAHGQAR